jgi:hypothetical protein
MEINNNDIDLDKDEKNKNLSRAGIGLWIMENRKYFIIALIAFLGGISLFLYSYFFYNLFDYIRYTKNQEEMIQELSESFYNVGLARRVDPIEILSYKMFDSDNSYDFLLELKNPNDRYFASVQYCFFEGDNDFFCSEARINPGEERYFIELSQKIESRPVSQRVRIDKVSWRVLDLKTYPDWENYYQERNDFSFSDIEYERGLVTSRNFNNLSFTVANNTPYNYWRVPLSIILYNRGTIVGVNKYTVSNFLSKDSKDVNISWLNSVSSVSSVKIYSDLDVLDKTNYMSYN